MSALLPMIVITLMVLTALVMLSGIFIMAKGGEANQKYGNKMMTLRVVLQALTIIAFVALALSRT